MIISYLFPKKCLGCRKGNLYLCPKCLDKVSKVSQVCVSCGKLSPKGYTHRSCRTFLGIDRMIIFYKYQGVIRQSLIKYKYKFVKEISLELSDLLQKKLTKIKFPQKVTLVTIPLHPRRQNWRGFNQTEEIGKNLAKHFKWDYYPKLLIRRSLKKPQVELKGEDRKQNVKGEYLIDKRILRKINQNSLVVVFDDVYTTGATVTEAVRVLKKNGIKPVWSLTIAR